MRPDCLGIVGLDVDPTETGATFLIASSLDSVLTRWSLDGKEEARKELGPAESWAVSIHPKVPHFATAGNEGRVRILSTAVDNFGEEIYAMDATGAFATTVKFVSRAPPPSVTLSSSPFCGRLTTSYRPSRAPTAASSPSPATRATSLSSTARRTRSSPPSPPTRPRSGPSPSPRPSW